MEAVDLLDVTQVVVGHDGTEPGRGWFLHTVTVSVDANHGTASPGHHTWTFPCDRYIRLFALTLLFVLFHVVTCLIAHRLLAAAVKRVAFCFTNVAF